MKVKHNRAITVERTLTHKAATHSSQLQAYTRSSFLTGGQVVTPETEIMLKRQCPSLEDRWVRVNFK